MSFGLNHFDSPSHTDFYFIQKSKRKECLVFNYTMIKKLFIFSCYLIATIYRETLEEHVQIAYFQLVGVKPTAQKGSNKLAQNILHV